MKVFTNQHFEGRYLTGTAAVVVAASAEEAALLLEIRLEEIGLRQTVDPAAMEELDISTERVRVLQDGDY